MEHFSKVMPSARLYELTGIQLLPINTLFQLHSMKTDDDPQLEIARDLLFMPDLLNYFLTGNKQSEFTISTTSQLFNPRRGRWEKQILNALGIRAELMQDIVKPGTVIGDLSRSFCQTTQLESRPVVAVASHDTAAAVAALPNPADGSAYISSGTWSLVGIEASRPVMEDPAFKYNVSNEGGVEGRFRVLKNVMGLWLLQSLRRSWPDAEDLDYETLVNLAARDKRFTAVIDVDDPVFLNPMDMAEAIVKFCRRTRQHAPHRTGQFVRIILEGLALAYRQAILQLQHLRGRPIKQIHVIGGGCKNGLLCQLTADATGCPVLAGPAEATAIGNLLVQAMAFHRVSSLTELRKVVADSCEIQHYEPRSTSDWIEASQFLNRTKERTNAIA
jgi:rhamnulokinase